MITLTKSNGEKLELDGTTVLRIRKTVPNWDSDLGNTLVNASLNHFVKEEASAVAALVKSELRTLDSLTQPSGSPVWFNAKASSGPIPVRPTDRTDGIESSLDIGRKRQYVRESASEVREKIKAGGGDVQPLPDDTFWTQSVDTLKDFFDGVEDWDQNRGVEQSHSPQG